MFAAAGCLGLPELTWAPRLGAGDTRRLARPADFARAPSSSSSCFVRPAANGNGIPDVEWRELQRNPSQLLAAAEQTDGRTNGRADERRSKSMSTSGRPESSSAAAGSALPRRAPTRLGSARPRSHIRSAPARFAARQRAAIGHLRLFGGQRNCDEHSNGPPTRPSSGAHKIMFSPRPRQPLMGAAQTRLWRELPSRAEPS